MTSKLSISAAKHGRDSIRETGKPVFLEAYTYRMRGHYEPDDQSYVDPLELSAGRQRIRSSDTKSKLLKEGILTLDALTQMEHRVNERNRTRNRVCRRLAVS